MQSILNPSIIIIKIDKDYHFPLIVNESDLEEASRIIDNLQLIDFKSIIDEAKIPHHYQNAIANLLEQNGIYAEYCQWSEVEIK